MKTTLGDLVAIRSDLNKLFECDIPIQTSWTLSKFIRQLESQYNDFETNRIKIVKKYIPEGAKKVPEDKLDEFRDELQKLLDVELEIEVEPITIEDLGNVNISPIALSKMSFLFKESNIQHRENEDEETAEDGFSS